MGTSIVAGVDAAPVLELAEHVLDAVTLAIEKPVVRDRDIPGGLGGDARRDALGDQRVAEPIGVVAPVGEQCLCQRQRLLHQRRVFVVAHLAFAEQHHQRPALAEADCVEL